ncbi:hypothetical protein WA026_011736 [Henosepilachna vigintioctopunctata]|uniref:Serine/arginine-rich splicing factor 2 n=1 Tax=Henosepilachna vigintioctopunctata TaxID=420089 RepID=A0AAW1UA30_9CUCU
MQSNMDTSLNKNKKRKSLSKVGNTPSKIPKVEEGTPSKTLDKKASIASPNNGVGSPQKVSKKKNPKSPVNEEKNEAKLNGKSSELKKLPFAGTKSLNEAPKNEVKKDKSMPKLQYLTQQMLQRVEKEGKDAVLKSLNERLDAITSRPEISKSAKNKIRQVKKMIKAVSGEEVTSSTNQTGQVAAKPKQKNTEKPNQNKSTEKAKNKNIKTVVEQKKKNKSDEGKSDDNVNVQNKKGNKKQKTQTSKKNIPVEESKLEESMESDEEEHSESENDIDSEGAVDIDEEEEMEDDDDASEEEESADDEEESADDEEESGDDEEESADDEEDSEDDDENEKINKGVEKQNKKVVEVKNQKVDLKNKNKNQLVKNVEVEHKKDSEKKSRYVLFVGNLGYSTTKDELAAHFEKAGNVVDVRIPTEKDTNKPRGFGYVEFADEAGYQRGLDLNGSQLSNRKIKVEYTQGGNKKSENQKSEIKSKNFKLHAMRKQGKFGGNRGPFKGGFKGKGKN